MKVVLAVTALALLVAGCGGGSSFRSAREVATAGGCTSPTPDSSWSSGTNPFATQGEMVDCKLNGHEIRVTWFKSADALSGYRNLADRIAQSGFGKGGMAYGDDWSAECNDAVADCENFKMAVSLLHGSG